MNKLYLLTLSIIMLMATPVTALAHGVNITFESTSAIYIKAAYDTGEPFSEGQVTIFAPDNPSVPWATGKADENGHYYFTPDPSKPGTWDVQVRSAGHGGMVHIPVGTTQADIGGAGYTATQIVLMGACAIWGFVGTALFFSRRKS
ncbi:carboxypeptidase regulatory-like domain-containing protein [Desulforamulus aquiferis]|uniref:Carboxypeptidase regulatory-like domain-containing protein n=1 Tax=Desulforamulus aquiferis TaxID=1397668 RepID=A0AAW7ZBX9_9FIRM|nr:carboxypeptidase regulatory-like domain-containing protein [Desulforamulus aquiferis]MDO7786793.1 carboxypeptidase regulatory-like domain-containing protein [Desulforamulus aquiferis]